MNEKTLYNFLSHFPRKVIVLSFIANKNCLEQQTVKMT